MYVGKALEAGVPLYSEGANVLMRMAVVFFLRVDVGRTPRWYSLGGKEKRMGWGWGRLAVNLSHQSRQAGWSRVDVGSNGASFIGR